MLLGLKLLQGWSGMNSQKVFIHDHFMVVKNVTDKLLNHKLHLIDIQVTIDRIPCHHEEFNKLLLSVLVIFDQSERKKEMTLVNFILQEDKSFAHIFKLYVMKLQNPRGRQDCIYHLILSLLTNQKCESPQVKGFSNHTQLVRKKQRLKSLLLYIQIQIYTI